MDEDDIVDTEDPKGPTSMKQGNILSVEEEFIKEIEENSEEVEDYTNFDPTAMDDVE